MRPEVEDKLLVETAQRGDREAFAALVVRHRPLLVHLCRRALGDATLAEDAAQEAVLQAFLSLDRLRNPARFGAWLAGIGLNVCRRWQNDQLRQCWSWDALLGGRLVREPLSDDPSPEAASEAADLRAQVHRAVAGLPSGQRAAVLLFYLEGFTQAETATLLGVEVGAVKTRLHKARTTLRKQLLAEWQEDEMDEKINRRRLTKGAGAIAGLAAVGKAAPDAEAAEPPVPMRIRDVRRYQLADVPHPQRHVVLLEDEHGEQTLPIWIGEFEGVALALQLEKAPLAPRPMTYQVTAGILEAAGSKLREVRISRLADEVFYAEIVVDGPDGPRAVDARPSDALNLALLVGAPIRVDPAVLHAADPRPEARWDADRFEDAKAIVAGMRNKLTPSASAVIPLPE